METKPLTVRVSADAARVYESAPDAERHKLDVLIDLKLRGLGRHPGTLEEVMSEISSRAQARGLTPEILRQILDER